MRLTPKRALLLQVAASWPVWLWLWWRLTVCPNERWELLPIAAVLAVVLLRRNNAEPANASNACLLPALLTALYAACYPFLPDLFRAVLAFTALTAGLSVAILGTRFHPGLWGLMLLSLQLHNGLQFYLGYPLRVICAAAAALLLRFSGFDVIREGICLNWSGERVLVDAPCSGVKMLWAAVFLVCLLSCLYRLSSWATLRVAVWAFLAVILANVWRAAALFFLETELIAAPAWSHAGIGVLIFVAASVFIMWSAERVHRRSTCVRPCL